MKWIIQAELYRLRKDKRFLGTFILILILLFSVVPVMKYKHINFINENVADLNGIANSLTMDMSALEDNIKIFSEYEMTDEVKDILKSFEDEKILLSAYKKSINEILLAIDYGDKDKYNNAIITLDSILIEAEKREYNTRSSSLINIVTGTFEEDIAIRNLLNDKEILAEFSKYEINLINSIKFIFTNYPIYIICMLLIYNVILIFCDTDNPDAYKTVSGSPYSRNKLNIARILTTMTSLIIMLVAAVAIFSIVIFIVYGVGCFQYVELNPMYDNSIHFVSRGQLILSQLIISVLSLLFMMNFILLLSSIFRSFIVLLGISIFSLLFTFFYIDSLKFKSIIPTYYLSFTYDKMSIFPISNLLIGLLLSCILLSILTVIILKKRDLFSIR